MRVLRWAPRAMTCLREARDSLPAFVALTATSAEEARRRQGTQLAAFFNSPFMGEEGQVLVYD